MADNARPSGAHGASVMWFRRDLRLADNPALVEACSEGPVLPLFVLDPALWGPAGPTRRAYLAASLRDLADRVPLQVVAGDPVEQVVRVAREVGAGRVHVAADFAPYGSRRDEAAEQALAAAGVELVRTGSPYAVAPGTLTTGAGQPFKVYSPFSRAWGEHGWDPPADAPRDPAWAADAADTTALPHPEAPEGLALPEAGEAAGRARWAAFLDRVDDYDDDRNKPGVDGTSRLSVHLKYGEVHPRTLLADLGPLRSKGAATYRRELAWRDFYADVLHARPDSAREYLRPEMAAMAYADPDDPGSHVAEWREGRTGFPIVDAGMRQLRGMGWVHNRVRMIVASFLVKDLHVEWQVGARHFMHWLVDGDLPSNQHGWQWVAGSGTDPAPYFRVFNPTTQGRTFDPDGAYVRRWVPELADVGDPHEPSSDERRRVGYPEPVVDHAVERKVAISRWEQVR